MSREEPPRGHKLFVGGLPSDCTPEELIMVFQTYGLLVGERVHIMQPKSKSGLRCAFVFYEKFDSAEDAIKVLDGVYKIREDAEAPIQVRWPRDNNDWGKGDWGKGGDKGGDWGKGGKGDWGKNDYGKGKNDWGKGGGGRDDFGKGGCGPEGPKLFVGTLPADCTEEELRIVFTTYGEVTNIHLMHPHAVTRMRCAFVTYARPESAEDAIKVLDGVYKIRLDAEQAIQVRWANERSKGGKGGKGKGYDGGCGGDWRGGDPHWGGGYDGGWQDGGKGYGGKGGGWYDDDWGKGKGKDKGKDNRWNGGKGGGGKAYGGDRDSIPESRVYVANLPEDIQQNAIEYVFGTYGKVDKVHIMSNKCVDGRVSAFVEYTTVDDAETAIASLHEKYEIRPGYGPIVVRHAARGRARPY